MRTSGITSKTVYESAPRTSALPSRVPLYLGVGQEVLSRVQIPIVRGSSSSSDTKVSEEDVTSRAVVSRNPDGSVTLSGFDGSTTVFQVRNYPLVDGTGRAQPALDAGSVVVTRNGEPVSVVSVESSTGLVELADPPSASDLVLCTYYFDRTDTYTTDDLSRQVTPGLAKIEGDSAFPALITSETSSFRVMVDGLPAATVSLPTGSSVSGSVVASAITSASIGTLRASAFSDNFGRTRIRLTASHSIRILSGTANSVLGLAENDSTSRNVVFVVHNGPIVDGSGSGRTTTNPSHVKVTVDGVEVTPVAVDGASRSITLPLAPATGSKVEVSYYWNSWQDTFDYLGDSGVLRISTVSRTPGSSAAGVYVQGVSYVLKDDRIVWGSAALVSPSSNGSFGPSKISVSLSDNKVFCEPADRVGTDLRTFRLRRQPTTGSGRGTSVDSFEGDYPASNPSSVIAYWGFGVEDALARGPRPLRSLDSETSRITFAEDVPSGATVYATYFYSTLQDQAWIGSSRGYSVQAQTSGVGGVGTYKVFNGSGSPLYGVRLSSKGSDLSGVDVSFPSGSEFYPDARIEGGSPVEETVTVHFAQRDETPAELVTTTPGPYYPVSGVSDRLRITVDGSDQQTGLTSGMNLSAITGGSRPGFFASLVGDRVQYTPESGYTTYAITAGVNDTVALTVDGSRLTAVADAGSAQDLDAFVDAINAAALASNPSLKTSGSFPFGYTVVDSRYDQIALVYTGSRSGPSGTVTITLTPGVYASAAALAAEVNARLAEISGSSIVGTVTCSATADARLAFTLALGGLDLSATLEFITATAGRDFCVVAGLDTDSGASGTQTKLYQGPIARRSSVAATSGVLAWDRIVLRNRIFPGSLHALSQAGITCQGGNGATLSGLHSGRSGSAGLRATVTPASIFASVGWSGGVGAFGSDVRTGQPVVTFYDGSGSEPRNNTLTLNVAGRSLTVVFTASGSGTVTALGPLSTSTTVLGQINAAIVAASLSSELSVAQEGCGFRLTSTLRSMSSTVSIGSGSANEVLGLSEGDISSPTPVSVSVLASCLMGHHGVTPPVFLLGYTEPSSPYFAGRALAYPTKDSASGPEYLAIQSMSLGSGSALLLKAPTSASALNSSTGIGWSVGDGDAGTGTVDGFYVVSSNPSGSGSVNDSALSGSGSGQDGVVGQTYQDAVTGLRFTILPRAGGVPYPTGSGSTLTFVVSKTIVSDGNIPSLVIPGVSMVVTNTVGSAGEVARVETFRKEGAEPEIGQTYYVSYTFSKKSFSPRLWLASNGMGPVEAEYGPATPDNPLSLAVSLAFQNGVSAVATVQVPKASGRSTATDLSFMEQLGKLGSQSLPSGLSPSVICLLTPATSYLSRMIALHADLYSSEDYKSERTFLLGFGQGTTIPSMVSMAAEAGSFRVRMFDQDFLTATLTDGRGTSRDVILPGFYYAAAFAAALCAPGRDVATPWESIKVSGFKALGRTRSPADRKALLAGGVSFLSISGKDVLVDTATTTDTTNVLTAVPTVVQIADEIQRQSRAVLSRYRGSKFLSQSLSSIESTLSVVFRRAVSEQLISSFTPPKASLDPEDPLGAIIEGFIVPVFPLLNLPYTLRVSSR